MTEASEVEYNLKVGWSGIQDAIGSLTKDLVMDVRNEKKLVFEREELTLIQQKLNTLANTPDSGLAFYAVQRSGIKTSATTLNNFLGLSWKAWDQR